MHGGCQKKMPVRVGDLPGSGCRKDCLHRAAVLSYRSERGAAEEARKLEREAATNGFETEGKAWDEEHPLTFTFKDWLVSRVDNSGPRE